MSIGHNSYFSYIFPNSVQMREITDQKNSQFFTQCKQAMRLAALRYLYLNNFCFFPAIQCWLKALCIWTLSFWISADFLCEVKSKKGHSMCKVSLSICIQSLKPESYPLSRPIMKNVKRTHFLTRIKFTYIFIYKYVKIPARAQVCLQKYEL